MPAFPAPPRLFAPPTAREPPELLATAPPVELPALLAEPPDSPVAPPELALELEEVTVQADIPRAPSAEHRTKYEA